MKVFWSEVSTVAAEGKGDGARAIRLDTRLVKTPGRTDLILPNPALADAVAAEWRAQTGEVDPATMPLTRSANSAIDRVSRQFDDVAAEIAAYGGTDLLCYRAPHPEALAARQAEAWDPLLAWAEQSLGAALAQTSGVLPVSQAPEALAALDQAVRACSAWELTALHPLVTLSGSLILGLAVEQRRLEPEVAWQISRIDEQWNIEQWGEDTEAARQAERKRQEFHQAARLLTLLRPA